MLAQFVDNLSDRGRMATFVVVVVVVLGGAVFAATYDGTTPDDPATQTSTGDDVVVTAPAPSATPEATGGETVPDAVPEAAATLSLDMPVPAAELETMARRAATFTAAYQSFRYDQDPTAKARELTVLLARNHLVDLSALTPSATAIEALRSSRTVVVATPTDVGLVLVSDTTVALTVTTTITTTSTDEPIEDSVEYSVTMTKDASWKVSEFSLAGTR